jgi:hypothetical protein
MPMESPAQDRRIKDRGARGESIGVSGGNGHCPMTIPCLIVACRYCRLIARMQAGENLGGNTVRNIRRLEWKLIVRKASIFEDGRA